ncbi:MRPS34 [Scenedesmus sp. PABB004]|nr:MRPS34 [Scenedesmus sp. PABB004]
MSLLALLTAPANRALLDVVGRLPALGVGARVTRASWAPYGDSYWDVTAVKPRDDAGAAGKVYGVLTWRGQREERPRLINGRAKRVWRWVPSAEERARLEPLARDMQRLAAARREAGGGGGRGAAAAAAGEAGAG